MGYITYTLLKVHSIKTLCINKRKERQKKRRTVAKAGM